MMVPEYRAHLLRFLALVPEDMRGMYLGRIAVRRGFREEHIVEFFPGLEMTWRLGAGFETQLAYFGHDLLRIDAGEAGMSQDAYDALMGEIVGEMLRDALVTVRAATSARH